MIENVRVRVRVRGLVQGVWFRAYTQRMAAGRPVTGWVRNMPDGTVEAEIQGPQDEVNALVDDIRGGPPGARVDEARVEPIAHLDEEERFEIRY